MVLSDLRTDEASQNEQYMKKANYVNQTMASILPSYLYNRIYSG